MGHGQGLRQRAGTPADAAGLLGADLLGRDFDRVVALRKAEADEFYAELTPPDASEDEAMIMRQAFGGMLWSKQLFYYDVQRWLDGDPAQPPPPPERKNGRNSRWRSFDAFDIISMPDKWEYPWFAAWDLAFHCVTLAHVDPAFAKYQLVLLCREWFQHPNGALPAYEWNFSDVNPPVQAWAALEVLAVDGGADLDFLSRVFDKLLVNFTWWINREDAEGNNLFEGGFLGLDNIGPIDRSHLPVGGILEQSDATGWMLLSLAGPDKLARLLSRLFDEAEFLSPHGIRGLSAWHREHPLSIDIEGFQAAIDYEPAESTTPLFGGNSNWRGPVWFPINYLIVSALDRYHRFFGAELKVEYPTGSGRELTLGEIADDLSGRLISLFAKDSAGHRPCFGGTEPMRSDPAWRDNLLFSEYFQGEDGAGLGASHQTGWTGLVADLIRRRHGLVPSMGDVIADIANRSGSRLSH